jgi:putative endonuclease
VSLLPRAALRFTKRKLGYVEFHSAMANAILREKRIKKWRRAWKIDADR